MIISFTEGERMVLDSLASGKSMAAISREHHVSESVIKRIRTRAEARINMASVLRKQGFVVLEVIDKQ